jgi:translocation and assembly module TamB
LSEPGHTAGEAAQEVVEAVAKVARGRTLPKVIVAICAAIFVVFLGLALTTRYGVLTPQGRMLIEARASGLKLGRVGKLKIEGLGGDIWRDFTVRRLTISDEKGVWLEAKNLSIRWHYAELFARRVHAERIAAQQVAILRRPTLTPKTKSGDLPVAFDIDAIATRLILQPAFSYRLGIYDVTGNLDVQRGQGGQQGKIAAASALHLGDHLNLQFDLGKTRPLLLVTDVVEARGGALAGALGLPADQAFSLQAKASGKMSEGRFNATALIGAARPLEAQGAWNPKGGVARGHISLTASTLTRAAAARIGPQAVFAIAGRQAGPDLYALAVHANAANLSVTARGQGNLGTKTLGPAGLAVTLAAPALSKLTGGPDMGAAKVDGVIKGNAEAWAFAGQAAVNQIKTSAYGLDRVSGPLEISRKAGVLSVKGKATGAGGRGQGIAAALLGGAPAASFDAARLADGRLLLRDVAATGAGLKVQASGGRGLTGGLTFKGSAAFSNLAAARAGASGALTATWSAAQGGAGKPWTLGLDAKGERLALGLAELDRLLGPAPTFQARANVEGAKVSVSTASLDGAAVKAATAGVLDTDGTLKFKLDWSASGPFHAGPVEVTGKAKGSGALTGTLGNPRADLLADIDAIDVPRLPLKDAHLTLSFMGRPDGSNGVVVLAATSSYGPASAKGAFRFPAGGIDLTDLAVDAGGLKASGELSLRKSLPSSADLKISLGKGAFLAGGQVTGQVKLAEANGSPHANLDLSAQNIVLPGATTIGVRTGHLTAAGPMSRLPYTLDAAGQSSNGRWTLDGTGILTETQPGYSLAFGGGGKFGRRELHTTEAAVVRFGGPQRSARLRLAADDGGSIALDADMQGPKVDIQAQIAKLGLGLFNTDLAGKADATLTVTGSGETLTGSLNAKLDGARGRGTNPTLGLDGVLKAKLTGDKVTLDAQVTNSQGLKANADITLPAEASAAPFRIAINRQKTMGGHFFADGEVKPIWDLLIGGDRELAGRVRLDGTIGGTLADPHAVGQASVDGGRFSDGATGVALRDVTLRASLAENAINVTQATSSDGAGGTLSGSGRISLLREGASTFRLDLKGFRLIDNDQATASASGQATMDRGADGQIRLAGALTIDRADVSARTTTPTGVVSMDVVERNQPADLVRALQPEARKGLAIALDVSLKAPRRIFLKGKGLDVELSLDAHVGGTTAKPVLSGAARVVRGDYDFAGQRFEFDDRGVVYLATSPQFIRLDLSATRDDPTLTAVVRIRGTAAKPEITLTSTPVLPNDEVLSQVLFGRSASQLSPLEAAELASALAELAGGGGFDVIGGLKNFAGLDRLALGGGGESGVTVSGGKYLTDDVYLEITGGGREGPSASVEWRIGRSLSIISNLASQGDGKLAVRWRKDY